ncbi:MAG TPA: SCO family protein [Gammaproteobacteria bacterium]|jgi:protein SCO1/2|nr:hypothetical protein [Acidiferrobacteraceae bacterium]MDP6918971.1 SCO family protein [Arenicellales bacterium]HCX88484.1 SCO family protein [Gammaproteobacteria bacterium]|tara:strand:- start:5986 stop:6606 length:621 start_codon:yes stop_codon:yes gene_type:complete
MNRRMVVRTVLALALAGTLITQAFSQVLWLEPLPPGAENPYPGLGGDFVLTSATGSVSLSDYQGKVVVIFFGYTFCPDICPTALTVLGQALAALHDDESEEVQPLFISLDPERDLPPRMAEYSAFFHPKIQGLTGTPEQIHQVARQYRVLYQAVPAPESALGYSVDHSGIIYVVGREGQTAALIQHGSPAGLILQTVRQVLARPAN